MSLDKNVGSNILSGFPIQEAAINIAKDRLVVPFVQDVECSRVRSRELYKISITVECHQEYPVMPYNAETENRCGWNVKIRKNCNSNIDEGQKRVLSNDG